MNIRKMQTAAGGPLKIKFTPEQIALFENQATRIPGMNNSGRNRYIKEGVLALQHLEQEAKRKEEEIKSRMEMRPTLKRRATTAEKLQGKKDEYKQVPLVVGMSGADPVGKFIVETIGLNGIGALAKTGLWNVAKYAPKTWLGNLGRKYFVGNAFKNSFNGAASTLGETGINISKPNVDVVADIGTSVKQTIPALSLEQIGKAFNQAKQWHLNRINSPGYRDRALRAGFTEEEIPELLKLLTGLINRLKLLKPEDVLGSNIKLNNNSGEGALNASYWKVPTKDGRLVQGISFHNPNMSYDDAVSSFVHEFGHGATFGLNGTEEVGYKKMLVDQFPLINRAVKYNKTLYPEVTEETVGKVFPYAAKVNKTAYFAEPTEIQSRGYEFMRDFTNNKFRLSQLGKFNNNTTILELTGNRFNSKLFGALTGNLGSYNFYKNALGISVPLGLGGYGLYSNDDLLQQLQYLKQGGKMNILEFLKNGSGIHIKEKNKGKFTSYCGGKVTNECILKGKNSSNPAIRKRATFADNARKWKHEKEGLLKFEEGGKNNSPAKTSWIKKAWSNLKDSAKEALPGLATDLVKVGIDKILGGGNNSSNEEFNLSPMETSRNLATAENNYAEMQLAMSPIFNTPNYGETININPDLNAHWNWELKSRNYMNKENSRILLENILEAQRILGEGNMLGNLFGSVVLNGLGALGSIIGNKETSTPTLNFFNSPSIQTKNAMAAPSYNFNTGTFNTKTIGGNLNFGVKTSFGTF